MATKKANYILSLIKIRNYKDALKHARELFGEHPEKFPMTLVAQISHSVYTSLPDGGDNMDSKSISDLTMLCCKFIDLGSLQSAEEKYIPSLYHILNYFIRKNLLDLAVKKKMLICSASEHLHNPSDKIVQLYYSCFYCFYNIYLSNISRLTMPPVKEAFLMCLDVLRHGVHLLLCMKQQYLPMIFGFLNNFSSLCANKLSDDCQRKLTNFQWEILDAVTSVGSEKEGELVFQSVLKLLCLMVLPSLERKAFDEVKEIVKRVFRCLEPVTIELKACNIATKLLERILFSMLEPSGCEQERHLEECALDLITMHHGTPREAVCVTVITVASQPSLRVCLEGCSATAVSSLSRLLLCAAEGVVEADATCVAGCPMKVALPTAAVGAELAMSCLSGQLCRYVALAPQVHTAGHFFIKAAVQLIEGGCPRGLPLFRSAIIKLNNIGICCYNSGQNNNAEDFHRMVCQAYAMLTPAVRKEVDQVYLSKGLLLGCLSYVKTKKFRKGMVVAAVLIASSHTHRQEGLDQWVSLKRAALSNNEAHLQKVHLAQAISEWRAEMAALVPSELWVAVDTSELLFAELQAYYKSATILVDASRAASSALLALPLSLLDRARAVELHALLTWKEPSTESSPTARDLCDETLMQLNTLDPPPALLGRLQYIRFLHEMKLVRAKQKDKVGLVGVPAEPKEHYINDPPDPRTTADITPTYCSLTVTEQGVLLAGLRSAVDTWSGVSEAGDVLWLRHVQEAAALFELYGCPVEQQHTWELCYKLAKAAGSVKICLEAAGHLLASWCTEDGHPLLIHAEELAAKLDSKSSDDCETLVSYWLRRSANCYASQRFTKGRDYLARAETELESQCKSTLLFCLAQLLRARYIQLPDVENKDELDGDEVMTYLYSSFSHLSAWLEDNPTTDLLRNTEVQCLLLEVCQATGEDYLSHGAYQEARMYMKKELQLAQLLGLPVRVGQLLEIFARIDLLCFTLDHCEEKVSGLEYVLCLENGSLKTTHPSHDITSISCQLDQLNLTPHGGDRIEVMLTESKPLPSSPGSSPVFRKNTFYLPSFTQHNKTCHCDWCSNPILQRLALDTVALKARLHMYQHQYHSARQWFKACRLINKESSERYENISRQTGSDCLVKFCAQGQLRSFLRALVTYSDFLAKQDDLKGACQVNREAIKMLQETCFADVYLQAELMEQHFSLVWLGMEPEDSPQDITKLLAGITLTKTYSTTVSIKEMRTPVNKTKKPHPALKGVKTPMKYVGPVGTASMPRRPAPPLFKLTPKTDVKVNQTPRSENKFFKSRSTKVQLLHRMSPSKSLPGMSGAHILKHKKNTSPAVSRLSRMKLNVPLIYVDSEEEPEDEKKPFVSKATSSDSSSACLFSPAGDSIEDEVFKSPTPFHLASEERRSKQRTKTENLDTKSLRSYSSRKVHSTYAGSSKKKASDKHADVSKFQVELAAKEIAGNSFPVTDSDTPLHKMKCKTALIDSIVMPIHNIGDTHLEPNNLKAADIRSEDAKNKHKVLCDKSSKSAKEVDKREHDQKSVKAYLSLTPSTSKNTQLTPKITARRKKIESASGSYALSHRQTCSGKKKTARKGLTLDVRRRRILSSSSSSSVDSAEVFDASLVVSDIEVSKESEEAKNNETSVTHLVLPKSSNSTGQVDIRSDLVAVNSIKRRDGKKLHNSTGSEAEEPKNVLHAQRATRSRKVVSYAES